MQMPSMLEGESLKRLLQGAAAGAVATIFVGFYWGGWSLGSTADKMAKERSELAVIAVLAPVCADKFRALPDAEAKQVALSKVDSWKRRDEFPKEFVTLPGESYPSSALVDACSTLLLAPKSPLLLIGSAGAIGRHYNTPNRAAVRAGAVSIRRFRASACCFPARGPLIESQRPCKYLQSCKENRGSVCCKVQPPVPSQQSLLAFIGVAGRSAAPLTRWQKSGQSWRS